MAWLDLTELSARIDLRGAVACGPHRDWADLIARREAWRAAFTAAFTASLTTTGARRVALYFEGTFEFTAALLGAWAAGATAVLPGDATAITTANLISHTDFFAGDFPDSARPRIVPDNSVEAADEVDEIDEIDKRPAFPATLVILFTSGTTGVPQAVAKSAADLGNELRNLEAALGPGSEAAQARVLATVGHQHIYGLLFRCLWPLAAGRPFCDATLRFPEEVAESLAAPGPALLVASPAFLKRLPDGPAWPHPPSAVFSSGGPLPGPAAEIAARLFGTAPTEIYGSTETGGIAWRHRNAPDTPWTPFPGVVPSLAADGSLSLAASPHVEGPFPFPTADRAEWAEGGLRLLGRADRIVKVEEKRLSLTAMEALLCAHARVAEAKVIVLPGARETLGAVLRLRDGESLVRGMPERDALIRDVRERLSRGFERVLLPKRWRLVAEMPANAAGKPALAALAALFEPLYGPLILRETAEGPAAVKLDLDIHPELEHFRGHFPEVPILPGVVQLDWAIREGLRRFGPLGSFRGLKVLKFQRPIVPGMRLTLSLSRQEAKGALAFAYDSAAGRHSSGQAIFA